MSVELQYECTRVPVTASASCGSLFIAAEGPFLRFYTQKDRHYVASKQVFQAQAIHGIAVLSESVQHVILVIWGGLLVRSLEFDLRLENDEKSREDTFLESWVCSNVVETPDWILDLSPAPIHYENGFSIESRNIAAVTAHNALLQVSVHRIDNTPVVSVAELTSSSRSILYSAHLLWESSHRVLVAAGTAFGEIMYWSWTYTPQNEPQSRIHRVFLGHEGSIFGVQISKELTNTAEKSPQRLLASCSDDRTIRIWNVSDVHADDQGRTPEADRTQHTGFANASFDATPSSSACLAIGWGHISRVWSVHFLDSTDLIAGVLMLSLGEDATSRTWQLTSNKSESFANSNVLPYELLQLDCAAYHSGKNTWSSTIHRLTSGFQQVIVGGADSKITACPMGSPLPELGRSISALSEYTVADIASPTEARPDTEAIANPKGSHKSSKVAEFFRSYAFLDDSSYLLTTNSGKVYLGSTTFDETNTGSKNESQVTFIDQPKDLNGYSICTGIASLGLVFVAGTRGSIYVYQKETRILSKLHTVTGKVGNMFAISHRQRALNTQGVILLATVTGQDAAQLLYIALTEHGQPTVSRSISVPTAAVGSGLTITSMEYMSTTRHEEHLFLGFRQGTIAAFRAISAGLADTESAPLSLISVLERVHDKETITALSWVAADPVSPTGYLVSTGRDGRLVVHSMNFIADEVSITLVHNLTLPVGPNIEGMYFSEDHLLVYGFSGKNFVLFDTVAEEELMGVDTGGAHRSWAFQPSSHIYGGGTLVWTRASSMHICHQPGPSHKVVRSGGHGREIKAVSVSPFVGGDSSARRSLIATGAEDTDIKIFEYENGHLVCRRTLRKHRTGIQHLQWSDDGEYLFSSGGCEEFYIWRVRNLPPEVGGIGVVCESVCKPESEHADLRLMSFDTRKRGSTYDIIMVYSDSNIRAYNYEPTAVSKWQTLSTGTYFTSCLTQCIFLSPQLILTAGTDGHAVLWPLPPARSLDPNAPTANLEWEQPARIHQNTSKTLATHTLDDHTTLIASGGDDGSLSLLVASTRRVPNQSPNHVPSGGNIHVHAPIIVTRAHASAVTACVIIARASQLLIVSSGSDQWVRLWEVIPHVPCGKLGAGEPMVTDGVDALEIRRLRKIKTNVADVSGMAVLGRREGGGVARVLICGVGMEILRIAGW